MVTRKSSKSYTLHRIEMLKRVSDLAEKRNGLCISRKYGNSHTKLIWECEKLHNWKATPNAIQQGKWCPVCARQARPLISRTHTIEEMVALAGSHGGKCLSEFYVSASEKLKWECSEGHEWFSIPMSVLKGHWCKRCSAVQANLKKRDSLDEIKEFVHKQKGECVSTSYINSTTKLTWKCAAGHIWSAPWSRIKRGGWCNVCRHIKNASRLSLGLEFFCQLAREKGGCCLSTEYKNLRSVLDLECASGHRWSTTAGNIRAGHWCQSCNGRRHRLSDLQEVAKERGGECLSAGFNGMRALYLWKCCLGHRFKASADSIFRGSWCGHCAKNRPLSLSIVRKEGKNRGFKLLSKKYKNSGSKLNWQCAYGHRFNLSWNHLQRGQKCRYCSSFLGEEIARYYFEQIFEAPFPAKHPKWLRSETGRAMELDGFNEDLGIAFEHQGQQHFEAGGLYSERQVTAIRKRDVLKRRLCLEHNVRLIELGPLISVIPMKKVPAEILRSAGAAGVVLPINPESVKVNFRACMTNRSAKMLNDLEKIAKRNKGQLLTKIYTTAYGQYSFRCSRGHVFVSTGARIKNGRKFCPHCGERIRYTKKILDAYLKGFGFLVSRRVGNVKQLMTFACTKGHRFGDTFDYVKTRISKGMYFCPKCHELESLFRS